MKARWTLPSKDYLKYTYQPSIPDKHFMGAHWNYAPSTMWIRHFRPLLEEVASAGWKTASDLSKLFTKPLSKISESHIPGVAHKVVALLVGWAAFSYLAQTIYGSKSEAWALIEKLHSFSQGQRLGEQGFWETEEMDQGKREKAAVETADRLEALWQSSIQQATQARSFQVLCDRINPCEQANLMDIVPAVSWRFGMIPFDSVDAHTFPDGDRKDIAVEVKPAHESSSTKSHAGHETLPAKKAREIYDSAANATAALH